MVEWCYSPEQPSKALTSELMLNGATLEQRQAFTFTTKWQLCCSRHTRKSVNVRMLPSVACALHRHLAIYGHVYSKVRNHELISDVVKSSGDETDLISSPGGMGGPCHPTLH